MSKLSEDVEGVEARLQSATSCAEEMQGKLQSAQKDRDAAMERANKADHDLGVERSLKDQLKAKVDVQEQKIKDQSGVIAANDARVKELEKELGQMKDQLALVESEKKAAEEAAEEAQTQYFQEGYTDALREARKLGWDYRQILLNPSVDPLVGEELGDHTADKDLPEGGDETPNQES